MAVKLSDKNLLKIAVAKAPEFGIILDYFLFCDDSFRIAPPLTIRDAEILAACRMLKELLDNVMKNRNE